MGRAGGKKKERKVECRWTSGNYQYTPYTAKSPGSTFITWSEGSKLKRIWRGLPWWSNG